ncbi:MULTISPECIES: hypothetical protein [Geomicrobium]|uniref:GAF domain-containing protein n=1 Tax=Geomicrobium sediminis TaxID=1347788 RepID=A0ABS2PH94_9BACL|nr:MULTISPECIES: hypothetical protein [Geomicrobium]MBM7634807.1 hypothetical protein [Geomicrobium sediminis]
MSIATDIAAIKIVAELEKNNKHPRFLEETVHTLVERVNYIHYAALHLGDDKPIVASDCDEDEYIGSLSFAIGENEDNGKLVVRTKETVAFDVTDLSTLQTVADRIGARLFAH